MRSALRFASVYCFDLYLYQNLAMWAYSLLKDRYFLAFSTWVQYLLGVLIASLLLVPMAFVMNKVNHQLSCLFSRKTSR